MTLTSVDLADSRRSTDPDNDYQLVVDENRKLRVERRRIEALVDEHLLRYGHLVPHIAADLALMEEQQAFDLLSALVELRGFAREAKRVPIVPRPSRSGTTPCIARRAA